MTEEFLHFLWKYRLFYIGESEQIEVIHPGYENTDAGPDFQNAKIRIDGTLWAGNVELHIHSSDWMKHGHSNDPAYNNVILHVVCVDDKEVFNAKNEKVQSFVLKGRYDDDLYSKYRYIMNSKEFIPCEKLISMVDPLLLRLWLDRVIVERLEKRSEFIDNMLDNNLNNFEETFYQLICRSFGSHINGLPFELLARSTPLKCLLKHKNNLFQLEAFLFGQAGMLEGKFEDAYPNELRMEYRHLQNKFSLASIDGALWKFLRLRPFNFPTIRLSQLAGLIHKNGSLFHHLIVDLNPDDVRSMLSVTASEYWDDHFIFDKLSRNVPKKMSSETVDRIIINAVVPFLFVYGKRKDDFQISGKAFLLLEKMKGEQNSVTKKWQQMNISSENAYLSQALLELKNSFCDHKRCLHCEIGNIILNS